MSPATCKQLVTSFKQKTMQLSKYQSDILAAVQHRIDVPQGEPIKGLLIEALAGTGKSFMLVEICAMLQSAGVTPDRVRLVVFGKKNKIDLAEKLASKFGGGDWKSSVSTLHSLSFQILREALNVSNKVFKIESWKYRDIASDFKFIRYSEGSGRSKKEFLGTLFEDLEEDKVGQYERDFVDLLELLRLYCLPINVENLVQLTALHQLEIPISAVVAEAARKCLSIGLQTALSNYWLDYTDMSWVVWEKRREFCAGTLEKYGKQFKMLAVDEAQDTDQLQLNILSLLVNPTKSFLIAVGDRHQAVYSFRGCVSDGLDKFQQQFNCERLPLPINYRCGRSHLELVREIFPNIPIEAHPEADKGEIKIVMQTDFLSLFADDSKSYIGVCRKNAPLISYAIKLLAAGKPAKIKDKSLGKKVTDQVEKIIKKFRLPYDPKTFPRMLDEYERQERERLLKYKDHEDRISGLQDMLQAVITLFENYEPETFLDWEALIDKIFDESDGKRCVNLYSIHSGKGGEADVAFILNAENMPLIHKKQSAEEREQENNLLYVALTRGRHTLALISDKPQLIRWLPRKYLEEKRMKITPDSLQISTDIQVTENSSEVVDIAQEKLLYLIEQIQGLPRSKMRTVMRELVDSLGKDTIAELLD